MYADQDLLDKINTTIEQRDSAEREVFAWVTFDDPEKANAARLAVKDCNKRLADLLAELTAILPD